MSDSSIRTRINTCGLKFRFVQPKRGQETLTDWLSPALEYKRPAGHMRPEKDEEEFDELLEVLGWSWRHAEQD